MAELAALHLCAQGCKNIIVANRTVERAAGLAERFGGLAVSLSDLDRVIDSADIVIGSISIDRPILTRSSLVSRSSGKPLFLIDLGVPRNFAPDLAEIDNVYLYNIDDLASVASANRALRESAARDAEIVIEYGLMQFERWRRKLEVQPEVVDLRRAVELICRGELEKALSGQASRVNSESIQAISATLSQKINHELTRLLERQNGIESLDHEGAPFVLVPTTKSNSSGGE
jgi:glutamyl-tRNA reductase